MEVASCIDLWRGVHFAPTRCSSVSGYWERPAEAVGLSLPPYTASPSTGSSTPAIVASASPPAWGDRSEAIGRLFSGSASGLDAFSPYRWRRSCAALPYRITASPEASPPRSSRTKGSLPSDGPHSRQIESDLSHDGLNPAHDPL